MREVFEAQSRSDFPKPLSQSGSQDFGGPLAAGTLILVLERSSFKGLGLEQLHRELENGRQHDCFRVKSNVSECTSLDDANGCKRK